jgi:SOS response regulatory protein OraA/RecX
MKKNTSNDSAESDNYKPKKSALDAVMDHLGRRNHSERELHTKLKGKYSEVEITEAIIFAQEHGWMLNAESLAEQTTNALHRKKKGFLFIQRYLRQKGLPATARDTDAELEKVRRLVDRRYGSRAELKADRMLMLKARRFLLSRGFQDDVIRKVLNESEE